MVSKQDAVKELNSMGYGELVSLVAKLHIEQYGIEPDPNVVLEHQDLVSWILNHYEWNQKDTRWKSKRYIIDAIKDFMVVCEDDLHPARLLH